MYPGTAGYHWELGTGVHGLEEKRSSLGDLGMAFYEEELSPNPLAILDEDMVLICLNSLFDGECECIHLTQGEPGIKYLL